MVLREIKSQDDSLITWHAFVSADYRDQIEQLKTGGKCPVCGILSRHTPVGRGIPFLFESASTPDMVLSCLPCLFLCSSYSQEVVCYTLGNIPQMPSPPRLVRAGVTWITLQWNRPEGCSPEEVITYTLDIQEDENVSPVDSAPAESHGVLLTTYMQGHSWFLSRCPCQISLPKLSKWLLIVHLESSIDLFPHTVKQ